VQQGSPDKIRYIKAAVKSGSVEITVQDTGAGIPADLDRRNAKSPGLRLAIAPGRQLSGTIEPDWFAITKFTIVMKDRE